MRRFCALALLGAAFATSSGAARAHASSSSYLQLEVQGAHIAGRWDIALRDLDEAIGLDADGDGQIDWGEVRQQQSRIAEYALARLSIDAADARCTLQAGALRIADHADGRYAALTLDGLCPAEVGRLQLRYELLFDLDRRHRGLLRLQLGGVSYSEVLGPQTGAASFGGDAASASLTSLFASYFREGVWHVWTGLDHLLFLAALFLPAVLRRTRAGWETVDDLRKAVWHTAGIVTAFTLAHAATLTLAALGWVHWPSAWVESAVAATVAFAGLNNLWPLVHRRLALLAAGFGLIHGSAIAGALLDLGLPVSGRIWALAAFNLGVEAAQLLLVGIVVPLTYALRHSTAYRRWLLLPGSALIVLIGAVWFVERVFGLKFLPF